MTHILENVRTEIDFRRELAFIYIDYSRIIFNPNPRQRIEKGTCRTNTDAKHNLIHILFLQFHSLHADWKPPKASEETTKVTKQTRHLHATREMSNSSWHQSDTYTNQASENTKKMIANNTQLLLCVAKHQRDRKEGKNTKRSGDKEEENFSSFNISPQEN